MIYIEDLFKTFKKKKISFFCGVPDSILKEFSNYLDKFNNKKNIISTNEGSAVSLGIGYHLATKEIPCVYMQNSGLGNAINPLVSIAHKKVYSIPLLMIIGWRGSLKSKDEPQHMAKGKITPSILKLLNIKYANLKTARDLKKLEKLITLSKKKNIAVACLVEKNVLKLKKQKVKKAEKKINLRKNFIEKFLYLIPKNCKIISTTGYTSRELFQIRKEKKINNGKDFYVVGGMGHASMVSLGISIKYKKQVFCLDGDGSLLMHMGSLRTIGNLNLSNFKHVLLNNNMHESVGGQITTANKIDFKKLVKSLGYKNYYKVSSANNYDKTLKDLIKSKGPSFLEVIINSGTLEKLTRPKNLLIVKKEFIENL